MQHCQTDTNSHTVNPEENTESEQKDIWLDNCIAFIRIGIGFLQVMNGITAALAFVPWPSLMVSITNHLQFIEFNIIDVATPQCLDHHFHFNHLWKTIIYFLCVTASLVIIAALYRMWVLYVRCRRKTNAQRRAMVMRFCLTTAAWILYACYPSLSQYIIATVPYSGISCIPLNCMTSNGSRCDWYLKADLSVPCHTFSSASWRFCQVLLFLPICLPLFLFFLLNMKRRDTKCRVDRGPFVSAVYDSLTFLHSDYEERFWFWEVVEMARKLILTSGLLFFTRGSATELAIASILANVFAVLHAQFHPIRQSLKWQHALQLLSLSVIALNIMLGVLKISSEDGGHNLGIDNANYNSRVDETVFEFLFYIVNGVFFIILIGETQL